MSVNEFASCMSTKVPADVDLLTKLGEDVWKQLIAWWKELPDWAKAYLAWVAGANKDKLAKAIVAIFGAEAWEVVGAILAGVALGVLIDSAIQCEDQL